MTTTDRAERAIPDELLPTAKCYTAEQVSAMTENAVSAYWLEKQARKEAIPARKVGRAWRWTDADVDALFEKCLRVPRQRSRRGS